MAKRISSFSILFIFFSASAIASTTSFQYGAQGSGVAGTHAILSRTLNSEISQFLYDQNGDLSHIEKNGLEVESYQYFVNRKTRRATTNQTENTSFFYTTTGEKVLTQHADGSVDVFLEPSLRVSGGVVRYTYGNDAETNLSGDGILFHLKDHLGSVVATLDSSGLLEQRDTLPYGEKWFRFPEIPELDRGFNGNLQDAHLYDYRARHYSPELASFIQSDSIIPRMDSLGFNRYSYVSGNPVNRIDPSGHQDVSDEDGVNFESTEYNGLMLNQDIDNLKTQFLAQGEDRMMLNSVFPFDAANYLIWASPDDPLYEQAKFEVGFSVFMMAFSLLGESGGALKMARNPSYGWFRSRPRWDLHPFVREFTPTWRLNAESALAGVRRAGRFVIDHREVILDVTLEGLQMANDLSNGPDVFVPSVMMGRDVVAELQPYIDYASGEYVVPSHNITIMTSYQEMEMHRAFLAGIPTIEIPANVHVSAYQSTSGMWRPIGLPR